MDVDEVGHGVALGAQALADRPAALALEEAVLSHPRVVVQLGEVAATRVGQEHDDQAGVGVLLGVTQGAGEGEAARAADEDPLVLDDPAGSGERLGIADPIPLVDDVLLERRWVEVLTNALHEVGVDVARVDRADGVGTDHLDVRVLRLEVAADAGRGAASADAADERVDLAVCLSPDLRTRRHDVRLRVRLVVVLVRLDVVGAGRELVGHRVVRARVLGLDGGGADHDLGAVGTQELDLVLGDLVRADEDAAVTLQGGGHRESDTGVARRGLDDRAPRLEVAGCLQGLDHGDPDAVLDRAAGVHHLHLGDDGGLDVLGEPVEPDHRGVTEECEDVRRDLTALLVTQVTASGGEVVVSSRDTGVDRAIGDVDVCHWCLIPRQVWV